MKKLVDPVVQVGRYLGQTTRLMFGVPDYTNYVEHMKRQHPGQRPLSYEEFFIERQEAKYSGKAGGRCC